MAAVTGFAVTPKTDCPHFTSEQVLGTVACLTEEFKIKFCQHECTKCKSEAENWVCLTCKEICCSRYVEGHMANHNADTQHPVTLGLSDCSFWCYVCESYLDGPALQVARLKLSSSNLTGPMEETDGLTKKLNQLKVEDAPKKEHFTFESVAKGLKEKRFKQVVVLAGAGMSVAAGIPDFRTPGTGLYSKLQSYNLPKPEAIFELEFFKKNPLPFYQLAKQYFTAKCEPTIAHKFVKKLQDENVLSRLLTQNIDGLDSQAGISSELMIEAHGHTRSAHCVECKLESPICDWHNAIKEDKILKCSACDGLVKPDIIFFGEQLPKSFFQAPQIVRKCDLAIIIGTSLKVMPFAFLGQLVPEDVPVVLINNTQSIAGDNIVWLKGDIQSEVVSLAEEAGWKF